MNDDMETTDIVLAPGKVSLAYGIYLTLDPGMFDELHASAADKRADIAVKYNGIIREFSLAEFLQRFGFEDIAQ